jgi:pimeloyl-ACP methyl ester carboxylesterase
MPRATVNDSGLEINYEIYGDSSKPPLVMTHGLGGRGVAYEPHVPALTQDFRVLLWDMRGYGDSDRPAVADGVYSRYSHAADLSGLLKALNIPAAHIHGHSLGGLVAQEFVLSYPDQTLSLIVQDSSAEIKEEYLAGWTARLDDIRKNGLSPVPEDPIQTWSARFIDAHPEVIARQARESAERNDPLVIAEGSRISGPELFESPLAARLAEIKCPVLIICGNEDRLTPPGGHVRMNRAIPQSKLAILPDGGHFINIETPEVFQDTILEFLRSI